MLSAYFDIPASAAASSPGAKTFGKVSKAATRAAAKARAVAEAPAEATTRAAKAEAEATPPPKRRSTSTKRHREPKRPKEPKPTEAATTSVHAKFQPLPPETNVPRPAEQPGQPWHALQGTSAKDDDLADADFDDQQWDDEDEEVQVGEEDELSEPDYEPDSLSMVGETESVSSSLDESPFYALLASRRRKPAAEKAVYSGPQLCYEDDDFD